MIKKRRFGLAILSLLTLLFTACEKEKIVFTTELPIAANTFLKDYFTDIKILYVVKNQDFISASSYEVLLDNGIKIKFDKNGDWNEVEAKDNKQGIPTSFIDPKITTYIAVNYNPALINGIEKEKKTIEIELTNGLDLVFNKEGDFVRIDP